MANNYQEKKYLGIDWGEKRIGLSLSDEETKLALPFKTVNSLIEVLQIIKEENIDVIILGKPQKMSGLAADNSFWLSFFNSLKENILQPIILIDERLSSLAADSLPGPKKNKANRDEIAASLILQTYLDSLE